MYEPFFGFEEKPFSTTPDPEFLYLGERHAAALTMLQYGLLNRSGITVLSGEIGAGKTTLIRRLLDEMDEEVVVGLISNTHESFGNLLQWISVAFDLPAEDESKAVLYDKFAAFLIDQYGRGRRTVIIVDEAQNLGHETLEELRLLTNINADKNQLLQLILIGQPELRKNLRHPGLEQFVQRIGVDYHLGPLSPEDTDGYIRHRLLVAGGHPDLIDDIARRFIHYLCDGVPRRINAMCDTALIYAFADNVSTISATLVRDLVLERARMGLFGAGLTESLFENPDELVDNLFQQARTEVNSRVCADDGAA